MVNFVQSNYGIDLHAKRRQLLADDGRRLILRPDSGSNGLPTWCCTGVKDLHGWLQIEHRYRCRSSFILNIKEAFVIARELRNIP